MTVEESKIQSDPKLKVVGGVGKVFLLPTIIPDLIRGLAISIPI